MQVLPYSSCRLPRRRSARGPPPEAPSRNQLPTNAAEPVSEQCDATTASDGALGSHLSCAKADSGALRKKERTPARVDQPPHEAVPRNGAVLLS